MVPLLPQRLLPAPREGRTMRRMHGLLGIRHRWQKRLGRRAVVVLVPLHTESTPCVCVKAFALGESLALPYKAIAIPQSPVAPCYRRLVVSRDGQRAHVSPSRRA